MQYLFRISNYGLVKHIRLGTITRQEDTHRVSGHPFEGQGHYDLKTNHYFTCNCYECFQCKDFLLHITTVDEKRKLHVELWVKRSKINLPVTFRLHLFSDRIS